MTTASAERRFPSPDPSKDNGEWQKGKAEFSEPTTGKAAPWVARIGILAGVTGGIWLVYSVFAASAPPVAFVLGGLLGGATARVVEHTASPLLDYIRRTFVFAKQPSVGQAASPLARWVSDFLGTTYDRTNATVDQRISWMRELVGKAYLLASPQIDQAAKLLQRDDVDSAASLVAAAVLKLSDYPDLAFPDPFFRRMMLPFSTAPRQQMAALRSETLDRLEWAAEPDERTMAFDLVHKLFGTMGQGQRAP